MIIGNSRPIETLTDDELHHHGDTVSSNIALLEDTEQAFGSEDLHNLRLMQSRIISEQGRRGMFSEVNRAYLRQAEVMARDFVALLHDIDGSRRGSPIFASPGLGKARDLLEEAVELVRDVLRERGA